MTSVAIRTPSLFVSTVDSPSKAAAFGLSPISTTTAKQTETPKKLKGFLSESNNDEEDAPIGIQRSDSWSSRVGFSPRPKRPNNNPARCPVQSALSIHALRLAEERDETEQQETVDNEETEPRGNQAHLERIQEADDSDDESENGTQDGIDSDENVDEYDGDGEEDETLQLYKSFSGDLVLRYNACHRSHVSFDSEDDDIVRI